MMTVYFDWQATSLFCSGSHSPGGGGLVVLYACNESTVITDSNTPLENLPISSSRPPLFRIGKNKIAHTTSNTSSRTTTP